MPIVPAIKNDYFAYFKVISNDGRMQSWAVREKEQVWTALGLTMQIQGTMPRGSQHWGNGTYNCFAKKHLVATTDGNADQKMANVVAKRDLSGAAEAHRKRGESLKLFKQIAIDGLENREKGPAIKAFTNETRQKYEQFAYGATRTDICTFVVLDGLDPQAVRATFAAPILAETPDWSEDQKKTILVTLLTDCVVTHELSGRQTTKNTMSVDVVKSSGSGIEVFYIFHCNG